MEKKDKKGRNTTLLAIGITGITLVTGFWFGYLLFNIVMR